MRGRFVARGFCVALVLTVLAACATRPPAWRDGWATDAPDLARCLSLYNTVDRAVSDAGVSDAEWARVAGFPYLRVSRFLASFRNEVQGDAFDAWVQRMRMLDHRARAIEIANLPMHARRALARSVGGLMASLDDCARRLATRDFALAEGRATVLRNARVDDDYADWQRVVGLYPLTALPIAWGSFAWRQDQAADFNKPGPGGEAVTIYAPGGTTLDAAAVAAILKRSGDNPLDIPEPNGDDLDALFSAFAPVFAVARNSPADRIGEMAWQGGESVVDTDRPVAYRLVSHTRVRGRVLLQLNYIVWFPARPKSGWFDLLGGHLDGLIWRVTLAPDGRPLVYDSIHPCGCYHEFYPVAAMTRTDRWSIWHEGAAAPGRGPLPGSGERVVVHLDARTHYVSGLGLTADAKGKGYTLLPYDTLRHLPLPGGGTRSLFAPSGLVRGTARGERFLFWPMGIASPGAMRQWGNHAIAFVGKSHFDDPDLIERSYRVDLP